MNVNPGGEGWARRDPPIHGRCHGCWNLEPCCTCVVSTHVGDLPRVPPRDLAARMRMLAEQLGIEHIERLRRHHPASPIVDLFVDYDPVVEAERVLYYQGD